MNGFSISRVVGREILDSRGNPTVEADVILENGVVGRGASPSGASTGAFEALELRDGDADRYGGKGVLRAVFSVNTEINDALRGLDARDLHAVDEALLRADGTADKSRLGANALLAVSIASAKAAARALGEPLFRFLGGAQGSCLPVPMMNILNGGAHASNGLDTQEFMIVPIGAPAFREGLRMGVEVYHALRKLLNAEGHSTAVGDEGGFAPDLAGDEDAIEIILRAIIAAGYAPGKDFALSLDAAASEWKSGKGTGFYRQPKSGKEFTADELIEHWQFLSDRYPIISIEDGLDEEDWAGWHRLTDRLGGRVQLVGDDLFVTNTQRLAKGIESGCANAILIKPNQIGTLSQTTEAVSMAHRAGYAAIASHRSGETEDTAIADLAVALNTRQIKTGAPCRSERTAKYNRLLRIEEELAEAAVYPGTDAFNVKR